MARSCAASETRRTSLTAGNSPAHDPPPPVAPLTAAETRALAPLLARIDAAYAAACAGDPAQERWDAMCRVPLASQPETRLLIAVVQTAHADADRAQQALLLTNARLVQQIVLRYAGIASGLERNDLLQEGAMGLLTAVSKFDLTRGTMFSTCATQWIRQRVLRALQDQNAIIRVPVWQHTTRGADAPPAGAQVVASLDAPLRATRDGAPRTLGDVVTGMVPDQPGDTLLAREAAAALRRALATLAARHAAVLRARFGMDGAEQTLAQIGAALGLTRERVRQIEARALENLGRNPALRALR